MNREMFRTATSMMPLAYPLETTEQLNNRIRYTGQQYDELTEQYYLRARYYNPVAGRFMQEDVYQGDGLNLYAYCGNNPVVYDDPSGYKRKACPPQGKISESVDEGDRKTQTFDIVEYGDKTPGLENHHGVLDVWATHNIDGYKSRANEIYNNSINTRTACSYKISI